MTPAKRILSGTFAGILISTVVHLSLAASLYYGFVLSKPAPIVAELDLSMIPLVPLAPNLGGGLSQPSPAWTIPNKENLKTESSQINETKEDVLKQEADFAPCPTCPQLGEGTGGGGTGEGGGEYVSATLVQHKPRWIKNFITPQDYPAVARQEGKDGRVVLSLLIDEKGHVSDARLLQGSYDILNEVALRKVRKAIFTPACNKDSIPVSCKVTLPIRFELK